MTRVLVSLLGLVCLGAAVPAQAQIYAWQDARGTAVYSDRPRQDGGPAARLALGTTSRVAAAPRTMTGTDTFDAIIERHAAAAGVPAGLVRAIVGVESGFNPRAVSPKGALGLMQLMPATARELGVTNPFDPDQNVSGGVRYLRGLLDRYGQDVRLALAAYNAGPAAVARYGDVPPFPETEAYLARLAPFHGAAAARTSAPSSPPAPPASRPAAPGRIYKWVEIVDGRAVPRYADHPPASGPFEVVDQP